MANINKLLCCTFFSSFFSSFLKLDLLKTALGHEGELDPVDTAARHGSNLEVKTRERSVPFDLGMWRWWALATSWDFCLLVATQSPPIGPADTFLLW